MKHHKPNMTACEQAALYHARKKRVARVEAQAEEPPPEEEEDEGEGEEE